MGIRWHSMRRWILTPNGAVTSLDKRGFHRKSPESQELLESVGHTFLTGYAYAAEAATVNEAEDRLDRIPTRFRGFAYEGAAMGFAILDGLPFGRSDHVARFLAGRGDRQIYTAYVGIGWAMARLPKFRWPKPATLDPLLRWLVLDGYGFHQAYFHTRRYVHEQYSDPRFPWPGGRSAAYANRAIDQGIGRALWFVGGTDVDVVTRLIGTFPAYRRPDLYSGAGLAATYAGGSSDDELALFLGCAGVNRGPVAQGAAFAAEARVRGGIMVPHTERAARMFCGMTAEQAARVTRDIRPDRPVDGHLPAYELWRRRIAEQFVSQVIGD